ncbi:MAG: nucleotidyltransferase domain-containing protein [Candidatus Desantisbacteria bacterium]
MIAQETIRKAIELLKEAANPVKIILFGSYARGNASKDSDLDFLVVEKELLSRRMEMVRLRRVLSSLRIPVDIIVVSERIFNEWLTTPGTIIYEAGLEGKIVYETS